MKLLTILARPAGQKNDALEIQGVSALSPADNEALETLMRRACPEARVDRESSRAIVKVPQGASRLLAGSLKLLLESRGFQLRCCV